MVRTKLTLAIVAAVISLGGTGLGIMILEKQEAQDRREKFFGSTKEHPTSGGEKIKVEW